MKLPSVRLWKATNSVSRGHLHDEHDRARSRRDPLRGLRGQRGPAPGARGRRGGRGPERRGRPRLHERHAVRWGELRRGRRLRSPNGSLQARRSPEGFQLSSRQLVALRPNLAVRSSIPTAHGRRSCSGRSAEDKARIEAAMQRLRREEAQPVALLRYRVSHPSQPSGGISLSKQWREQSALGKAGKHIKADSEFRDYVGLCSGRVGLREGSQIKDSLLSSELILSPRQCGEREACWRTAKGRCWSSAGTTASAPPCTGICRHAELTRWVYGHLSNLIEHQ